MLRDWQRNQLENFSHNNWQHLRPTPRTAREVFGKDIEFPQSKTHHGDKIVGYACALIFLVYLILGVISAR